MDRKRKFDPDHPTGAQLRAARGLVNLTVLDVAGRTGLVPNTIKRAEGTNDLSPTTRANARVLVRTFTELGVIFLPADETGGAGVRLKPGIEFAGWRKRRPSDPQDAEP
jgi:transcriptional regulator with XRE-family HTH domain